MTARLEAARVAVLATVQQYMPAHRTFSDEGTRRLKGALAELEAAAVDAAKPGAPPVLPISTEPAPDLVKLNEPAAALPGGIGGMSADTVAPPTEPAPAPLASPAAEVAASKAATEPPAEKPAKGGKKAK